MSGQTFNLLTSVPRRPDPMISQASYGPTPGPERNLENRHGWTWNRLQRERCSREAREARARCPVRGKPFQLSQRLSGEATPALHPPALLTPRSLPLFLTRPSSLNSYLERKRLRAWARHQLAHDCGDPRPPDLSCLARESRGRDQGRERRPHPGSPGGRRRQGGREHQLQVASSCPVLCHVTCLMPSHSCPGPAAWTRGLLADLKAGVWFRSKG